MQASNYNPVKIVVLHVSRRVNWNNPKVYFKNNEIKKISDKLPDPVMFLDRGIACIIIIVNDHEGPDSIVVFMDNTWQSSDLDNMANWQVRTSTGISLSIQGLISLPALSTA
jgi:hypothetical protein